VATIPTTSVTTSLSPSSGVPSVKFSIVVPYLRRARGRDKHSQRIQKVVNDLHELIYSEEHVAAYKKAASEAQFTTRMVAINDPTHR